MERLRISDDISLPDKNEPVILVRSNSENWSLFTPTMNVGNV